MSWWNTAYQTLADASLGPLAPALRWADDAAHGRDTDKLARLKSGAAGLGLWTVYGQADSMQKGRDTAQRAADDAQRAGEQGAAVTGAAGQQALAYGQQGQDAAAAQYRAALASYQQEQQALSGMFAQQRQAGSESLQRLNDVLIGGDMSKLQLDPGYAFQSSEAQKALAYQSNAQGMYGSGGNIKDSIRTQQGLASQAYGQAIDRLMGLAGQGQQANQTLQQLNSAAAGNVLGAYGALANNYATGGQFQANITLNSANQAANARNNVASTISDYKMQGANLQAAGLH